MAAIKCDLMQITSKQGLFSYHKVNPLTEDARTSASEPANWNSMKTIYVLVADEHRAKLYRSASPPDELTLLYHQRNLRVQQSPKHEPSSMEVRTTDEEFARSLGKMLKLDCDAGRFDGLLVIGTGEFSGMIYEYLSTGCRNRLFGGIVQSSSQLSDQGILAKVQELRKSSSVP